MPDGGERTFSEAEHTAILADRVAQETASLTSENDRLKAELAESNTALAAAQTALTEAQNRADVAEVAKQTAEKELADFQAKVEEDKEKAARKESRIAELKSIASLDEEYFTDEARIERVAAMEDEAFKDFVDSMRAVAGASNDPAPPRQTAMRGQKVEGAAPKSAVGAFLMRDAGGVQTDGE